MSVSAGQWGRTHGAPTFVDTVARLRELLAPVRQRGERIALVPTMGNLHEGHLELVREAARLAEQVVVSVFVNPLQFGPAEDFAAYPRTLDGDVAHLASLELSELALFLPPVTEVYPFGEDQAVRVTVPGLSDDLCGRFRPGHFVGVATVVAKLLNMVQPDVAVFGEKDLQQLRVIERMVTDLCLPIRVVPARIAREADGLAMSSRNRYLTAAERVKAPLLHDCLQRMAEQVAAGGRDFAALERAAVDALAAEGFRPDYVAIRRYDDLALPQTSSAADELVVLAAAWLGDARLIDNVRVARGPDVS